AAAGLAARPAQPGTDSARARAAIQQRVTSAYGRLPTSFTPRPGQAGGGQQFLARGSGYSVALGPTEAVLAITSPRRHGDTERSERKGSKRSVPHFSGFP